MLLTPVAGGRRFALYELTRPEMAEHFAGRFDCSRAYEGGM